VRIKRFDNPALTLALTHFPGCFGRLTFFLEIALHVCGGGYNIGN